MQGPGRAAALRELDAGPSCPPEVQHVWEWFQRLHVLRGGFGGGIPETEIAAFFRNRHIRPLPSEIELIAALDAVAMGSDEE